MRATLAALVVALGLSASATAAGTVHLAIHEGRVDLKATGASISQILDEWARVGGTRVVNADRLPPLPVTLELDGVPEAQAIDTLLRSAAGFIAVPRRAAQVGASQFERILILAASAAPAVTAAAAPPPPTFAPQPAPFAAPPPMRILPNGAAPVLGPDGRPIADDQQGGTPPGPPGYPPNGSMPPGFSTPPAPAAAPVTQPPAPSAAPASPVGGASVPGTIVKPQPIRRPGGH